MENEEEAVGILAIDLGLRTGFAFYRGESLLSYRSTHFQNVAALKKSVWSILSSYDDLAVVIAEGDRHLAQIWEKAAQKQGIDFEVVSADIWRADLFSANERESGARAKEVAHTRALEIIEASGAANPVAPLTSDVAEAIVIGYWASSIRSIQ